MANDVSLMVQNGAQFDCWLLPGVKSPGSPHQIIRRVPQAGAQSVWPNMQYDYQLEFTISPKNASKIYFINVSICLLIYMCILLSICGKDWIYIARIVGYSRSSLTINRQWHPTPLANNYSTADYIDTIRHHYALLTMNRRWINHYSKLVTTIDQSPNVHASHGKLGSSSVNFSLRCSCLRLAGLVTAGANDHQCLIWMVDSSLINPD